ncbi:hypothetical protein [Streptomyces litchfieldiae]|uniref:Uncharacterized protein n=1 Tax=Streptomyces litchfieldiae TaxID=3075543 RepID=A0ABU2N1Q6_9ACTN|nr:hypothetical protein [Streptomyces sp. DSM 44938]MDT0347443.1 hypothetical protein [Streptomyces sp. DSM 44938]
MSSSIQIYFTYPGDITGAAQLITVALDAPGYFWTGHGFRFGLRSLASFDSPGSASMDLSENEEIDDEDGTVPETALSPYDFEVSVELHGVPGRTRAELRKRAGRRIFERLTRLDRPLALAEGDELFTDFLPGRGVREFPPGTSCEEPDRSVWFEPWLHAVTRPAASVPKQPRPGHGAVSVFETAGLVHCVPREEGSLDAAGAGGVSLAPGGLPVMGHLLRLAPARRVGRQAGPRQPGEPWRPRARARARGRGPSWSPVSRSRPPRCRGPCVSSPAPRGWPTG